MQAKSDSEDYLNNRGYKDNMSYYKIIKNLDKLN